MLIWTKASSSKSVNRLLVNCDPWSLLKVSGRPCDNASFSTSTSTQNPASNVADNRQESTYRLAQSRITTRYKKPRSIGMYVMSVAHTYFARVITRPRSRYGYTLCRAPGTVVFGRG